MDELKFNYHSRRSELARIGASIKGTWLIILPIAMALLLIAGATLVAVGSPSGWAVLGFSVIPAMVVEWYKGGLYHLPTIKRPDTIDGILSGVVLGRLSSQPTPREVAAIVCSLPGGQFMMMRFGIGFQFMQAVTSNSAADMASVWGEAIDLKRRTNSKNISAAILLVALIKCTPNYKALIGRLQLSPEDLVCGIEWYNHLQNLINEHRIPKKTGGVARDWSFGFTPLLDRFGRNISRQVGMNGAMLQKLAAHDDSLERLTDIFSRRVRQNAVLVGPIGSGKTEIIKAFASKIISGDENLPSTLKYNQVVLLDSSSLISAASGRGELEELITKIMVESYRAKNIILCLDNAQVFFEDGIGSVDLSNVFLPIIEAGNLKLIFAMDEQNLLQISRRQPELVNFLNRVNIKPATKDEVIAILQDRAVILEYQNGVTFMYQALSEAYQLGLRYVYDLAMPGKAVRLIEEAVRYGDNGLVTANSVQRAVEATMGVKVGIASGIDERQKLLNLEKLIHERMIGQTHAVSVVCDAIRRARAGVGSKKRPIGTFLFLGPTGVGKTELAKALADVYFGGEDRIIRLDMNEYVTNNDVKRLIADGADNPNSLTAKMMKQPFSVVLLDEIEKAHPNVLLTLLQMLDEGILRDVKNREVSFRDAIVVATSNAAADKIRECIDRGYDIDRFEDKIIDSLINDRQFHAEFLNRFDEIVLFKPLDKTELLKVVDLITEDVNKTLAPQKVSVKVDADAKKYLVEVGYDPKMGARPMRRIVQKAVENIVAKMMLEGSLESGGEVNITLEQVKQTVEKKRLADGILSESNS